MGMAPSLFNISVTAGAPLPTSAADDAALMVMVETGLTSGTYSEKHEFILQLQLQDGEHARKIMLVSFGMAVETDKSFKIKVVPGDDGGTTVVKVECSYKLKLMPVPDEIIADEKIIAESSDKGRTSKLKVKLD